MKAVGIIMIIVGLCLGLYVGVWLMFIGGIVDVINEIRADDLSAMAVAIGVAKVCLARFVGSLYSALLVAPGAAFLK